MVWRRWGTVRASWVANVAQRETLKAHPDVAGTSAGAAAAAVAAEIVESAGIAATVSTAETGSTVATGVIVGVAEVVEAAKGVMVLEVPWSAAASRLCSASHGGHFESPGGSRSLPSESRGIPWTDRVRCRSTDSCSLPDLQLPGRGQIEPFSTQSWQR